MVKRKYVVVIFIKNFFSSILVFNGPQRSAHACVRQNETAHRKNRQSYYINIYTVETVVQAANIHVAGFI